MLGGLSSLRPFPAKCREKEQGNGQVEIRERNVCGGSVCALPPTTAHHAGREGQSQESPYDFPDSCCPQESQVQIMSGPTEAGGRGQSVHPARATGPHMTPWFTSCLVRPVVVVGPVLARLPPGVGDFGAITRREEEEEAALDLGLPPPVALRYCLSSEQVSRSVRAR